MWKGFTYELMRLYGSYQPRKWEKRRDKRFTKDECMFCLNIWLLRRHIYLTCVCMYLVRVITNLSNKNLLDSVLDQVFISVLRPGSHGRIRYQSLRVTPSSCYDSQCTSDFKRREETVGKVAILWISTCWMFKPGFLGEMKWLSNRRRCWEVCRRTWTGSIANSNLLGTYFSCGGIRCILKIFVAIIL